MDPNGSLIDDERALRQVCDVFDQPEASHLSVRNFYSLDWKLTKPTATHADKNI